MNIISAHGLGDNHKLFIWSSDERKLTFFYFSKVDKFSIQLSKKKHYFGNHYNLKKKTLPRFILCHFDNNEIMCFSKSNTDNKQDEEINYKPCHNDWVNSNESIADLEIADAVLISCGYKKEGLSHGSIIKVHTWTYHNGWIAFYSLQPESNGYLTFTSCDLCQSFYKKLHGQIIKIEKALNIKMELPQFLLNIDDDTVSKFDLNNYDNNEVTYKKRQESVKSKDDLDDEIVVNVLLNSFNY